MSWKRKRPIRFVTVIGMFRDIRLRCALDPPRAATSPCDAGDGTPGRLRLEIVPNRSAKALVGFVEQAVEPGAIVIADAAPAYAKLGMSGYAHLPVVEAGNPEVAEEYLPIVHLVFS